LRILVIEDDLRLVSILRAELMDRGHVVDEAVDGSSGLMMAREGRYDAIVLDIMLPVIDGLSVARELRRSGIATPILMLTARDETRDVIEGLKAGADDYLRKPFVFDELDARLLAITRRETGALPQRELRSGDVCLDLNARRVYRSGREIVLTARETAFLELFLRNPGKLFARRELEDLLWEHDRESGSNVIEVYVGRLRRKLSANGEPAVIETVRGGGYRFAIPRPN
jgi:two-component system OmpR family response regulator